MAEGFAYEAPAVVLDIYGVEVSVSAGDVAVVGAVDAACGKLLELDESSDWRELSETLRGCIRSVMGDAAFEEAFGERPANAIEEIECLAYIRRSIREALDGGDALVEAVRRLVAEG